MQHTTLGLLIPNISLRTAATAALLTIKTDVPTGSNGAEPVIQIGAVTGRKYLPGQLQRDPPSAPSLGTINKMLQQWKTGQKYQTTAAAVLPPPLQRALFEFIGLEFAAARAARSRADRATKRDGRPGEGTSACSNPCAAKRRNSNPRLRKRPPLRASAPDRPEADLAAAKDDAARERGAAERARTEHAKALLRLEAMRAWGNSWPPSAASSSTNGERGSASNRLPQS